MKPVICLIEDDPIMGEALVERLEMEGYGCDWFQRGRDALLPLQHKRYALAISDIRLPDLSGEDLFVELQRETPALPPFLFITGHGAIDQAVRLLKLGAADYLTKPLDIPALIAKVRELAGRHPAGGEGEPRLGISNAMRRIEAMLPRLAKQARTVLITGESGVGKEVVARTLHELAAAGQKEPFIAVNCGAIAESLMESELFGHERGAFTGAVKERRGAFELARGGTLFLDEIGDMPLSMQVKLLRALQERSIVRVGGEKTIQIDFRLILATHRDLKKMVEEGRFREDLYYRVHVVQIDIPPLRERREDILWLADRFLAEFAQGGGVRRLDADAEQWLIHADWPGNVRELRHALERACILSDGPLLTASAFTDAEEKVGAGEAAPTLAAHVAEAERRHILSVLAANHGRIAETAAQLGISRKNLWEKMKKHGIREAGADSIN
ncbi:sigma-54-dependent transcriptional regulator [Sulfuricystis multivorans]|uniref:sigma-54-dependent transcriptional regulator n=1 Tax=Sulfuricystis multivorans TaxID=2211108 RepID=UPI000F826B0D|nr:sigma-54 dependent transcriptional regulator [Sulfuricystis multivorans]